MIQSFNTCVVAFCCLLSWSHCCPSLSLRCVCVSSQVLYEISSTVGMQRMRIYSCWHALPLTPLMHTHTHALHFERRSSFPFPFFSPPSFFLSSCSFLSGQHLTAEATPGRPACQEPVFITRLSCVCVTVADRGGRSHAASEARFPLVSLVCRRVLPPVMIKIIQRWVTLSLALTHSVYSSTHIYTLEPLACKACATMTEGRSLQHWLQFICSCFCNGGFRCPARTPLEEYRTFRYLFYNNYFCFLTNNFL